MHSDLLQSSILALLIGAASGSIGSFVVLKRMALVGDALSHVALPGIAVALAYKVDPFWGVVVFLLAAVTLVWWMEQKTKLPTDALVGLLFTSSLAIGVLTIPDHEIFESLFGAFPTLSTPAFASLTALALILIFLTFFLAGRFLFVTMSADLAKVEGSGQRYNLFLLLIFALVVALGIKLVGALLMGALTIIPPSIAKNFCSGMRVYMATSAVLGAVIGLFGFLISYFFGFLPGPTIILFGAGLFVLSLVFPKQKLARA